MHTSNARTKNPTIRLALLGVAACAFMLAIAALYGCSNPAPSAADKPASEPQSSITIALPSQAGTGYTWDYQVSPEGALTETSHETKALDNRSGGNMEDVFVLKAAKSGDATVLFKLARSWEDKEAPAETAEYQLSIDQNMNISVKSTKVSAEGVVDPVLSK